MRNLRTIWIGGRSAYIESFDLFDMLASPHLANEKGTGVVFWEGGHSKKTK